MPGLTVYSSNRLEILVDRLAQVVAEPPTSPLVPEVVVVQSRGMERWLSMELARRCGVWANCEYPFPNAFLQATFDKLLPDLPESAPFSPDVLAFRIMGLLPACLEHPQYKRLKRYLEGDSSGLKLYQLAGKLADTFDQYLMFRPDMIFRWEQGREEADADEKWQADLWRRLVATCGDLHRAGLLRRLINAVGDGRQPLPGLPERISIFGISYLPLFHLEALGELSRRVPVHFFLMNPCREYWGDIVSEQEVKSIRAFYENETGVAEDQDLFLERGNPLLASMGRMGRDFFKLITGFEFEIVDLFEEPAEGHLLTAVQADILNLADSTLSEEQDRRGPIDSSSESAPGPVSATIQFHACHSPMREVEVLYDHLLAMFQDSPALAPRDICVMVPDIEAYAPFIHAVFAAQPEEVPRIPYAVADRSVRKESRVGEAFLSILEFKASRFGAGQVMALLASPPVQARFGLSDREMQKAAHWVRETNIRWGVDGNSRQATGLPRYDENTWKAGIDRMLLGVVMPGRATTMFRGILPYDQIEGRDAQPLGKFIKYLDTLFEVARGLRQARTLTGWRSYLMDLLERFFEPNESSEPSLQVIRTALEDLGDYEERSDFKDQIALEAVKAYLAQRLDREQFGYGFLTGGVTFCALLPMRSIPFKVICLVGMNGDDFPRDSRAPGFDLIARNPRPGDRSRRTDDKYLFLEAIVSARDRLYISYVGRNIEDNTSIPPSVPVSELIDYLRHGFGLEAGHLLTEHRLQAFSPAYFRKGGKLFSYSRENLEAAVAHLEPSGNAREPFLSMGLDPPTEHWRRIGLDRLGRFFRNPSRFLLRDRLGLNLEQDLALPEDRENFATEGLDRFQMLNELVEAGLCGRDMEALAGIQRAQGRLPPGAAGQAAFGSLRSTAVSLVERTERLVSGHGPVKRSIELEIDGFFLSGRFNSVYPVGWVRVHPGFGTGAWQLDTWIHHLARCSTAGDSSQSTETASYLLCRDKTWGFFAVDGSREILKALLACYWAGLMSPLAFFPESSLAYCEQTLVKGGLPPAGFKAARAKWEPNPHAKALAESEDPNHDLCFSVSAGAPDPFDDAFAQIAESIFGPMLKYRREID